MTDAALPHCLQHERLRVALYGIERVTGEACNKAARRCGDRSRAQADERLGRTLCGNNEIDVRQVDGRDTADRDKTGIRHRTNLPKTQEATPDRRSAPGDR